MTSSASPLRVVTFNVLPLAYHLVRRWAEEAGNKFIAEWKRY